MPNSARNIPSPRSLNTTVDNNMAIVNMVAKIADFFLSFISTSLCMSPYTTVLPIVAKAPEIIKVVLFVRYPYIDHPIPAIIHAVSLITEIPSEERVFLNSIANGMIIIACIHRRMIPRIYRISMFNSFFLKMLTYLIIFQ